MRRPPSPRNCTAVSTLPVTLRPKTPRSLTILSRVPAVYSSDASLSPLRSYSCRHFTFDRTSVSSHRRARRPGTASAKALNHRRKMLELSVPRTKGADRDGRRAPSRHVSRAHCHPYPILARLAALPLGVDSRPTARVKKATGMLPDPLHLVLRIVQHNFTPEPFIRSSNPRCFVYRTSRPPPPRSKTLAPH